MDQNISATAIVSKSSERFVATFVSPSGPREILSGDSVENLSRKLGVNAELQNATKLVSHAARNLERETYFRPWSHWCT